MLFNGNLRLENLGGMDGRTDARCTDGLMYGNSTRCPRGHRPSRAASQKGNETPWELKEIVITTSVLRSQTKRDKPDFASLCNCKWELFLSLTLNNATHSDDTTVDSHKAFELCRNLWLDFACLKSDDI